MALTEDHLSSVNLTHSVREWMQVDPRDQAVGKRVMPMCLLPHLRVVVVVAVVAAAAPLLQAGEGAEEHSQMKVAAAVVEEEEEEKEKDLRMEVEGVVKH